jgi:hypothetical protein
MEINLHVFLISAFDNHFKWVPCHHGMVHPKQRKTDINFEIWEVRLLALYGHET